LANANDDDDDNNDHHDDADDDAADEPGVWPVCAGVCRSISGFVSPGTEILAHIGRGRANDDHWGGALV
jgi:hypothetical protein